MKDDDKIPQERAEQDSIDADVRDELEYHLEMRTQENISRGMDPAAARAEAERRFGRAEVYAEAMRETESRRVRRSRRGQWWSGIGRDVRIAVRAHIRRPQFAVIVVFTLALGVGASATVFSFADQLLLTPVPGVSEEQTLATVTFRRPDSQEGNWHFISYPDYQDLADATPSVHELAAAREVSAHVRLPGEGNARRMQAELITVNYVRALGLGPIIGRAPVVETGDDPRVVMISDGLWREVFGRSLTVLNSTLTLNGQTFAIVGVAPTGFRGHTDGSVDLWAPIEAHEYLMATDPRGVLTDRRVSYVFVRLVARLGTMADTARTRAAVGTAVERIVEEHPESSLKGLVPDVTAGIGLTPGQRTNLSGVLRIMTGVVAFLLLLAGANTANLLLGRATGRSAELAVRRAIGAGRGQLVRQLVTEGVLLAGVAGVVGFGIAMLAARALQGVTVVPGLPPLPMVRINARVLAFTTLLSAVTGLLFSVVPALAATRNPAFMLRSGRGAVRGGSRLRTGLVVSQIAISLALLVGAGLLLGTVRALRNVDVGFDPTGVAEASVDPGTQGYDTQATVRFFRSMLGRSRALAGVRSAGLAWVPVTGRIQASQTVRPEGEARDGPHAVRARANTVTDGLLATLGMELVAGRDFRPNEVFDAASSNGGVAIISESMAKTLFPDGNALGRRIDTGLAEPNVEEVIGIVRDIHLDGARRPVQPLILVPFGQSGWNPPWATLYVRVAGEPEAAIPRLRSVADELDGTLPLYDVQSVATRIDSGLVTERRLASASTLFALIALILAGIGLYGVVSYGVTLRSREFGVRMALGARQQAVQSMVLRHATITAAAGILIGLAIAAALARFLSSRLFGVTPFSPAVFASGAAVLLVTALVASWLPAWRATRVDPVNVLRDDSA